MSDPRDREMVMTADFGLMRRSIAERLRVRLDSEAHDPAASVPPLGADSTKTDVRAAELIAKITDSLSTLEKRFDAFETRERADAAERRKRKRIADALARAEADAENGRPFASCDPISRAERLVRDFESPATRLH
jgi:hypothetical protein